MPVLEPVHVERVTFLEHVLGRPVSRNGASPLGNQVHTAFYEADRED